MVMKNGLKKYNQNRNQMKNQVRTQFFPSIAEIKCIRISNHKMLQ